MLDLTEGVAALFADAAHHADDPWMGHGMGLIVREVVCSACGLNESMHIRLGCRPARAASECYSRVRQTRGYSVRQFE